MVLTVDELDAELVQMLLDEGCSESMIGELLHEANLHPFGDDARDYEDEYPHGMGDD